MTESMIERVACAISGLTPDQLDSHPRWVAKARRAIEVMREPTETMKAANDEVHWGYSCAQCGGLTEGWYAMMDAALEGEK